MSKPKKNHQAPAAVNGIMECKKQHRWKVKDLNPEREFVNCPVCGGYTNIKQGLTYDGPPR